METQKKVNKKTRKEKEAEELLKKKVENENKCAEKINMVLKEFDCILIIDPNSPISQPKIVVEGKK